MHFNEREVRISVQGLTRGMFVCRLDRPWLGTSFRMQGVHVHTEAQLRELQRLCTHVWVDTGSGLAPDLRYIAPEGRGAPTTREAIEVQRLRKQEWRVSASVGEELPRAEQAHETLKSNVSEVMQDLRSGKRLDMARLQLGVKSMVDSVLRNPAAFVWLKELKRRDDYTYQHALGSAVWAANFGRQLGMEREALEDLALSGLLCDVGKTQLPLELLTQSGPLDAEQAAQVRRHVQHSLEIVQAMPGVSPRVVQAVAAHHERHDGSGYPRGLKGAAIPIFGRIMSVVDSYDAMTCIRPYAESRSPHQAVTELYEQRGRLFQAELVEQFIQACGIYPTGTLVELSSGEVGVVVEVHSLKRLRPRVMLLLDRDKAPLAEFREIDLATPDAADGDEPLTIRCGLPVGAYGIDARELFLG